jgi:hypothetical protein
MLYRIAADVVVGLHVAWVMAVVFGLVLFLIGGAYGWGWVRNRWIRGTHLTMMALVLLRVFLWSNVCPLTTWEYQLRELGGQVDAEGYVKWADAPVGWFLHLLIHQPLPMWVYPVVYSAFGLLVLATFWFVPVRWRPETYREPLSCQPSSSASP